MKRLVNQHFRKSVLLLALAPNAWADSAIPLRGGVDDFSIEDNFRPGLHEVMIGSSIYSANVLRRFDRPDINYASGFLQAAYTVTSPGEAELLRGSFQVALEAFGAEIYHGPGSYVAGGTLWFRYNLVQPGWRLVPFVEFGGGGTSLNIPHNYDGKDFNFNLNLGAGVRYFITERCSLNVEYRYQHISNANLWQRNVGVNTAGPSVGISYFF